MLSAFQATDYLCTVVEACGKAGMVSRTYRYWFDDPGFAQWWHEQAEEHFGRLLPKAWGLVWGAANGDRGGSAADRKLLIERFDKGFAPKHRSEQSGEVKLTVSREKKPLPEDTASHGEDS